MALDWRKRRAGYDNSEPRHAVPPRQRIANQRAAAKVDVYTEDVDERVMGQRRSPIQPVYYEEVPVQRVRKKQQEVYYVSKPFLTWGKIKFLFMMVFAVMIVLAVGSVVLSVQAWWGDQQNHYSYGQYQISKYWEAVGHKDSAGNVDDPSHPSLFLAFDDHGQIIIIEFPRNDQKAAYSITGPVIPNDDPAHPVLAQLKFGYYSNSGKIDMDVMLGNSNFVIKNSGSKFTNS